MVIGFAARLPSALLCYSRRSPAKPRGRKMSPKNKNDLPAYGGADDGCQDR